MSMNIDKVLLNRGITRTSQKLTTKNDKLAEMLGVGTKQDVFVPSKAPKKGIKNRIEQYIFNMIDSVFNYKHLRIK